MNSLEDMLSNSELFEDNVDFYVNREISSFFKKNTSPKFEDVKSLVDELIMGAWNEFAEQTGKKDVRNRISDFYKKIYSIKHNSSFQVWMTKSEEGQELYGRVMDLLRSEQFPDPRMYSPEQDKRTVINEKDLEQADFDIRKKCLEDIINNNHYDMITEAHLETIYEAIGDKSRDSVEMYLGRMHINHAVDTKVILRNLGYDIDLNSLLNGNENIVANKIPLDKEKRNDKTFLNFELEEMGIPEGFSYDEWKMVEEYAESLEGLDEMISKISVPKKEHTDMMFSENIHKKETGKKDILGSESKSIAQEKTEKSTINKSNKGLMDMLKDTELLKDNVDFKVTRELSSFFAHNESPKFEDVKSLVDKLIAQSWNQFAEQTGKKDTRARISDFYNKIYSIKANPKFQVWMTKSEEGQELYGRVMDLLRSEQFPDPRAYSPERDKRTTIENGDLKQADYDIRKKCFIDIINNNDFDMMTSSHLQTLCEMLGDKPKYSIEMYLGRMDMNHAVQMKGILQNLGYSVDLNALLTGNENIVANKIPLDMEKRYDKTFQNFELEEMGIPTGFSFEEWKMVQEHDESMENMDRLEAIFSESEIGKRTISRDIKRLDSSQERTDKDSKEKQNAIEH